MSHIEKRGDRYRARFSDPTGKEHSRTFKRRSDAQRFLRELDADMLRGTWVDPRDADTALADWAEVLRSGEANCPFEYGSWEQFWRGTTAAGPTQMAIGLAGLEAVEEAIRKAVEPFIAEVGSIAFDTNTFMLVVGRA